MMHFCDNTALCLTGVGGILGLDFFRPEDPVIENWIDWGDEVPIIGMIDAPDYIAAGGCRFDDFDFLGFGPEQAVVQRGL